MVRHRSERTDERLHIYCLLADQSPDYEQVRYATSLFGRTTPFVTAVSYTHLDVYKRQVSEWSEVVHHLFLYLCATHYNKKEAVSAMRDR